MKELDIVKFCKRGYTEQTFYCRKTDTELLIEEVDSRLWFCFRGSEPSLQDWINNFLVIKRDNYHLGYKRAVDCLYKALKKFYTPTTPIGVTGHSLGGALGRVWASYLVLDEMDVQLRTYGAPSVGNQSILDLEPANTIHFSNRLDPVCYYPPALLGYHKGTRNWFTNLCLNPHSMECYTSYVKTRSNC